MFSLFNGHRVGLFLDAYSPGTEKRNGEDVKTLTLSLRVQPFDATLALAVDEGLGGDSNVRPTLFNLTSLEPKPHLERANLSLACPPQTLRIFPAPDAPDARLALTQVRLDGWYARKQKDVAGWAFCFKGVYGEVGRDELEFVHHWFLRQQFVTFEESEPSIDTAVPVAATTSTLGWDDGEAPNRAGSVQ